MERRKRALGGTLMALQLQREKCLRGSAGITDVRANAIRALAMGCGAAGQTPATPARRWGMAEMAVALWAGALKHNPGQTRTGPDRDRFRAQQRPRVDAAVRHCFHLTGLRPADRRAQAVSASCTARRPAIRRSMWTPGVETTTGPARPGHQQTRWASRWPRRCLAKEIQTVPGHEIVRPPHLRPSSAMGCLMEGISHEACSLAGVWGAGQADRAVRRQTASASTGPVDGWFPRTDTPARFRAYGWNVIGPGRRPRRPLP